MNLILPKRGDELALTPDEIDAEGLAVARIEISSATERRRMRVKIRGAVPGDTVRARVESRVRDDLHARVAEILTPSPDRVEPRCRHARYDTERPYCGGCTLQSVGYERQLALKAERVRRAFAAVGVDLEVRPTRPAPTTFGHRHKMELSFAADPAGEVALGLHPPGYKWEVVSLAECPLLSARVSATLPALEAVFRGLGLRPWDPRRDDSFLRNLVVREAKRTDEVLLELVTTPRDPVETRDGPVAARALVDTLSSKLLGALAAGGVEATSLLWTVQHAERGRPTRFETTVLAGRAGLREVMRIRERELALEIDPRAFFQPHPLAAEGLVDEVLTRLGAAHTVLDLYSGTGTMALAIAPFVARVIGVEIVPEAVENARANAARNALSGARFVVGDVGQVVADPGFRGEVGALDAILCDPPRSGLSPQAIEAVTALGAPRIVYVSCKPESLARDLCALAERGYRPDAPAQPVDMFPQSHHVETVVSLSR